MDWDWEDGPPRDTPPRRAPDRAVRADSGPAAGADAGSSAGQPAHPAAEQPAASSQPPPDRPAARLQQPPAEATQRAAAASAPDWPSADERPRTSDARAAARARRRKQIRQRRLIALAAVVVILIVLVFLVVRACGGPASSQASAASPSPAPVALRMPTAKAPLRMAAYGESVGGGALLGIKLLTEQRKDVKVHRFVKVASGLTRPDFFDWPVYLEQDMAKRKQPFEAVLVMFGANDGQDTKVGDKQLEFGTGSWNTMYSKRVGDVMDFYLKKGVKRVYWAGMPRMGIGWFNKRMEQLNAIYKAEAAKRAPQGRVHRRVEGRGRAGDDVSGGAPPGRRRPSDRGGRDKGGRGGAGRGGEGLAPAAVRGAAVRPMRRPSRRPRRAREAAAVITGLLLLALVVASGGCGGGSGTEAPEHPFGEPPAPASASTPGPPASPACCW